jgi:hypothetical protein
MELVAHIGDRGDAWNLQEEKADTILYIATPNKMVRNTERRESMTHEALTRRSDQAT